MIYKFKSKATGDLILLEPDGRQLLGIIGKDAGPKGIILPGQMAAAVQALEQAIGSPQAEHGALPDQVSLRQRALPYIDMLKRCAEDGAEIVWGA
jgi:hypothetical protein